LLIGLLRGGDAGALAGVRGDRGRWHRPLLDYTREELRTFLERNGCEWLEDPYNENERFTRVKVRRHLEPVIRETFGDGAWNNLAVSAVRMEEADEVLSVQANEAMQEVTDGSTPGWVAIETAKLVRYVDQVRSRVLLACWAHAAQVPIATAYLTRKQRDRLAKLASGQNPRMMNAGDVRIERRGARLIFDGISGGEPLTLAVPGRLTLPDGGKLEVKALHAPPKRRRSQYPGEVELMDADHVGFPLTVRAWRPGDKFYPLGRSGRETKVVRALRRKPGERIGALWVVIDANGEIIWVPGERIAHGVRLRDETERVLKLRWRTSGSSVVQHG
jgi:tRNA(Ile)-lysidine synthase